MSSFLSKSSLLPDLECSICAQRGHGLHFGVVTCRACASFFSRSITQKRVYKCLRGGNKCDIKQEGARKACRFCRLQMCLRVGMRNEEENQKSSNLIGQMPPQKSNISKIVGHDSVEISEENSPNLFKFVRGYRSFVSNQRSAFIVKHPELVFQNISMVNAGQADVTNSMIEAKPLMFTMLNEHIEPFGQMLHEKKIKLFEATFEQILNLHRYFLTISQFPGIDDLHTIVGVGYMVDVGKIDEFFRENTPPELDPDEYFRIKKPLIESTMASIRRFKLIGGIKEQDFCALMIFVLWNEADQADLLNDEIRHHKETIIEEWLENLNARFEDIIEASKFMARLLCLLVELKTLILLQRETMAVYDIFEPVIGPKMCEKFH